MKRTIVGIAIGIAVASTTVVAWPGGSAGQTARAPIHRVGTSSPSPGDGSAEAIKVHGRWTIETRNPDGSVGSVTRFENALTTDGAALLADYLGRSRSVAYWAVEIAGDGICSTGGVCTIVEPSGPAPSTAASTLQVSNSAGVLTLEGTYPATEDGVIAQVRTVSQSCPADTAPATMCGASDLLGKRFTIKTLDTFVDVVADQQVLVKVEISFS
jgi:hypothetical protein